MQPRSRSVRHALKTKDDLEKERLRHRSGGFFRYENRDNPIDVVVNCPGYIGPRERMTAGAHCEEVNYMEREHAKVVRDEITEVRRKGKYDREEHRWRCIANADQGDVDRVVRMQHDPMMGRKNVSGQPFNIVNHCYDRTPAGAQLEHHDNMIRYRSRVREAALAMRNHLGFNPIIGEQIRPQICVADAPDFDCQVMDFKQQLAKANKDSRHFAPPSSTATAFGAGMKTMKHLSGIHEVMGAASVPSSERYLGHHFLSSSLELLSALFKRRSDVDSAGQTWESRPEESSADAGASHLAGLTFDAPSAQEWLKQLEPSPEEDLLADALVEGLAERQKAAPSHVPRAVKPEESRRLKDLVAELGSLQDQFSKERERLGAEKEEIRAKAADIARREAELEAEKEAQRKREDARRNYPQPAWLEKVDDCINIAVVGNSGVGKSLLINRLRKLRPQAEGWAAVGVNETTKAPTMYPYPSQPLVRLWDLPGAGTAAVPAESYLQDMGLRYFDEVIVVTAGRFTEMEVALRGELENHGVPFRMVRTKVDQDIANNKEDNFAEKHETLKQIRDDLEKTHKVETSSLYLVSSRDPDDYDMLASETGQPLRIVAGKGAVVRDDAGKEYLEAMAGLWCTALGWGHEELVEAAAQQMRSLSYYHCFAGRQVPVAEELADKLISLAPDNLQGGKVFFGMSGSDANDTQLGPAAVALQYRQRSATEEEDHLQGQRLSRSSLVDDFDHLGCHAAIVAIVCQVTLASGSLTGYGQDGESETDFVQRLAQELEDAILAEGPNQVAAFFAEPLQGAGGVILPPSGYFPAMREVCERYDVMMVGDEVITGFGRTGQMWGCTAFQQTVDFLSCAKQLTSGYVPLSAAIIPKFAYEAIEASTERRGGVFGHGFTYTGHPVSCAGKGLSTVASGGGIMTSLQSERSFDLVALKLLEIFEREQLLERVAQLAPHFQRRLHGLAAHPLVGNARGIGLIGAIELVKDKHSKQPFEAHRAVAAKVVQCALERGLIVRVSPDEVDEIFDRLESSLTDAAQELAVDRCLKRQPGSRLDPDAPVFCPVGTVQAAQARHAPSAWTDAWALPPALSIALSGLQGGWCDAYRCVYLVQNDHCHVTLNSGQYTVVPLSQDARAVWWLQRWYVDDEAVVRARTKGELRWTPTTPQDQPLVWWYYCS
ncbi:GABA-TP3 [Symbiodinium pilosum]|uniref:GABA-TP3 protein n=1 Tax=Symbiodinium pilosum TaxID=2952 RepID=A0A812XF21_SYMPI|nr:GABA-TP3 [Symbiodinium pilosum]